MIYKNKQKDYEVELDAHDKIVYQTRVLINVPLAIMTGFYIGSFIGFGIGLILIWSN